MDMELRNSSRVALTEYTVRQIAHFFPDGSDAIRPRIEANLSETLHRLQTCINSVRCWKENECLS